MNNIKRGFTLIELLIVIAVIGVLAGAVITIVNPIAQFQKANDAKRKADLSQIEKALETFYQDNGKYPDVKDYKIKSITSANTAVEWGAEWLPYMGTLPKDPNFLKNYVYNTSGDRQSYYLYASLDRETNTLSNFPSGAGCGSGSCNYGVSSPNVSP